MHASKGDPYERIHGVVQVAHGMGEHIGRYGELIGALTAAGFAVYGNDHRGHRRTAPSPEALGDVGDGFDRFCLAKFTPDQFQGYLPLRSTNAQGGRVTMASMTRSCRSVPRPWWNRLRSGACSASPLLASAVHGQQQEKRQCKRLMFLSI